MRLIILVGLPASGKSTWAEQQKLPTLSSDALRVLLTGDIAHQGVNRLVFRTLRYLAAARLQAGAAVTCIDSTALTGWERRCWVRFAEIHRCSVEAVYFEVPLEECRRRNALRGRAVPDDVLDLMAARLRPPRLEEGFDRITVVDGANSVAAAATAAPAPGPDSR